MTPTTPRTPGTPTARAPLSVADLGTWDWDIASGRLSWNAAFARLYGLAVTEGTPAVMDDVLHPDDVAAVQEAMDGARLERGEYRLLFRIRRADDGAERWMEGAGRFHHDEAGVAVRGSGVVIDVTGRMQAEARERAELRRDHEREFQAMADNIPQLAWMATADGEVYWWNGRWYEFSGHDPRLSYGDNAREVVHPEHVDRVRATFAHAVAIGEPWEDTFPMIRRDGEARWFLSRANPIRDEGGRIVRWFGTNTDISDRLHAELEQHAQREVLDTVLANVPIMIALWRADGTLEWANGTYAATFGWRLEEMQGRDMLVEFYPDPAYRAEVAAYMARGGSEWTRQEARTRDGRMIPTSWANVRLADGRTLGIGRDDSAAVRAEQAQERLEQQLRQAQKMEAVGQLAGGIAHDFNNLLTAIIGNAELARAELPRGVRVQAELAEVESAARRAAQLTRQLLAFSRKQVLQPRRIDLNAVVSGAERLLRRVIGEEIVLETLLSPSPCPVLADPGQLEQVLMNLAVNARDAMLSPAHGRAGHGGVLTIETLDDGGAAPDGAWVRLRVRDTGHGMDAETRAHAFEPFFTTKAIGEGTGLGLATVYGIVTQSGGLVTVDSEPGAGTTFTIALARAEGECDGDVAGYAMPAPRGVGTLLLVEDEALVRTTVRRMLERRGYSVLEARHGADALAIWREHRGRITALVTDVRMPEMGGIELASIIHADDPGLPVVFMSGYTDQRQAEAAERGWHVAKPFTSEALAEAVHEAIAAGRATRD